MQETKLPSKEPTTFAFREWLRKLLWDLYYFHKSIAIVNSYFDGMVPIHVHVFLGNKFVSYDLNWRETERSIRMSWRVLVYGES